MRMMPVLVCALLLTSGVSALAEDVFIPLPEGPIVLRGPRFIRPHAYKGHDIPELSFVAVNTSGTAWKTLQLSLELRAACNAEERQWEREVTLRWHKGSHLVPIAYSETVIPLLEKVDGCRTESIKARLVRAEDFDGRIIGELTEDDKREAAITAERKRREAQAAARAAKERGAREANAAEEARRIRANCEGIYKATADKKLKDLTVREEQQVRACQALGWYPPR